MVGDYAELFAGPRSLADLQRVLTKISKSLGFQKFVYHVLRAPAGGRRLRLSAVAESSAEAYEQESCPYPDEVLGPLGQATVPYRWNRQAPGGDIQGCLARFFDEQPNRSPVFGVTVPLHGPGGGLAALCFASRKLPSVLDGQWPHYRNDLILIGSYAHHAAQEGSKGNSEFGPHLTLREGEVLLWTARGKTAWEIGEILGISEETVRFHLKNATRKFEVGSKHQAVVQAILSGMIVP